MPEKNLSILPWDISGSMHGTTGVGKTALAKKLAQQILGTNSAVSAEETALLARAKKAGASIQTLPSRRVKSLSLMNLLT